MTSQSKGSGLLRIGMITPSANTVVEDVTIQMLRDVADVRCHFTRVAVEGVGLDERHREQFATDRMVAAAVLLADADVDVIVWNGTSGSWLGVDADLTICREIYARTGKPATTSTLAVLAALDHFGVDRFSLALPFETEIAALVENTFAERGYPPAKVSTMHHMSTLEKGRLSREAVVSLVEGANSPSVDAVVAVCTNLNAALYTDDLERTLGVPLLDSVAVSLWHAMWIVGAQPRALSGWGQFLGSVDWLERRSEPAYEGLGW